LVDVPEIWQVRELQEAIRESRLNEDGFRFERIDSGGRIKSQFRYLHQGYPQAVFFSEWMDLRDPTGYSGVPKGAWHVVMRPGTDGPEEEAHYIPWRAVIGHFREWIGFLAREFAARRDWGAFVELPRLPPPVPPSAKGFEHQEIEVIEPMLLQVEEEFVEVFDEQLATQQDLAELRSWLKTEFEDVRVEIRRQSKRAFRRTLFGLGANIAIKVGPQLWTHLRPMFEALVRMVDETPTLPGN